MIPNVVKGADMRGLIRYLVDTREAQTENVHTEPHVISGDDHLVAWHGSETLNFTAAAEISDYLDEPRKRYGTTIQTKVWEADPDTGARVPATEQEPVTGRQVQRYRDQHVWHCSLSLGPAEGPLGDAKWDQVATEFMDRMGFTEASGKAPCRWVAIHHGLSTNGNDHIHLAASMVREDGTRWEGRFRDFKTAQEAARAVETSQGLVPVEGREHGTATRGTQRAETERATRTGAPVTLAEDLAGRVRAAAAAATSEAEWVRRLRGDAVIVKPYFAKGTTDVVAGYRVAIKPGSREESPVFYGGGRLGKDLSLPRLRENWPEADVAAAEAAAGEWQAAFRSQPPVGAGRETKAPAAGAPRVAVEQLAAMNQRLSQIPLTDRAGWGQAAGEVSGALSAWARYDKANAAELRNAAQVVARSAQDRRPGHGAGQRPGSGSSMATAFLFAAARPKDRDKIMAGLMIQELMKAAMTLRDYHRTVGHLRQAQALQTQVLDQLQQLPLAGYRPGDLSPEQERAWQAQQLAAQGRQQPTSATPGSPSTSLAGTPTVPGSPLPRPLAPAARREPSTPTTTRRGRSSDESR